MCYTKKIDELVNSFEGSPKFAGRFDCSKFKCTQNQCNEGLVDGDQPKRKHDYTLSIFIQ